MILRTTMLAAAALVTAVTAGCRSDGNGPFYRIEVPRTELRSGAAGRIDIRFVAADGYHWNRDYPAKFAVDDPGSLSIGKKRMTKSDFTDEGGTGLLKIEATGETAGPTSLNGKASFSVCNPKECRILKDIPVKAPVSVRTSPKIGTTDRRSD